MLFVQTLSIYKNKQSYSLCLQKQTAPKTACLLASAPPPPLSPTIPVANTLIKTPATLLPFGPSPFSPHIYHLYTRGCFSPVLICLALIFKGFLPAFCKITTTRIQKRKIYKIKLHKKSSNFTKPRKHSINGFRRFTSRIPNRVEGFKVGAILRAMSLKWCIKFVVKVSLVVRLPFNS
ncbi:hypothetical protein HanXRQr2_Chr05g0217741 [Helianthus annuus]|uniref:Uncharacterized protein n=1 Tax=Helianthus annuus TaxID=4232 RepID=A0A9K3J0L3_HELAN|nr:hypothetical protein HanXRQr2_Chr05g0217741 [Helianthus annuus]KAJ0584781.1 hypothetical protein HanHA89_Chr05g0192701 [Helianthus annuus]KAJ0750440.1 hypothetical protein HanLR1_Chr05g0182001 [Helianthus annuus]